MRAACGVRASQRAGVGNNRATRAASESSVAHLQIAVRRVEAIAAAIAVKGSLQRPLELITVRTRSLVRPRTQHHQWRPFLLRSPLRQRGGCWELHRRPDCARARTHEHTDAHTWAGHAHARAQTQTWARRAQTPHRSLRGGKGCAVSGHDRHAAEARATVGTVGTVECVCVRGDGEAECRSRSHAQRSGSDSSRELSAPL